MELTEEQQKHNATLTLVELINCGINRGVYSSVEVNALKASLSILTTPATPTGAPLEKTSSADTYSDSL